MGTLCCFYIVFGVLLFAHMQSVSASLSPDAISRTSQLVLIYYLGGIALSAGNIAAGLS